MSEFIYLFRSDPVAEREAMGTPEAAQKSLEVWMEWIRGLETAGHLKDHGRPLERTGKVVRRDKAVTDGPFVEAKDLVLGFIVVAARDLEQAIELAHGCPMLAGGGSVEVRPVWAGPDGKGMR